MRDSPPLPRASLALVALLHALVLGAAAAVLPWAKLTPFAIAAGVAALGHLGVAVLAAIGHRWLAPVWRVSSCLSIVFLGYVTYAALASGIYVSQLYGGIGNALAAASGAAWCIVGAFTIPIASWGFAKTRGAFRRRAKALPRDAGPIVLSLLVITAVFGAAARGARSRGEQALAGDPSTDEVRSALASTLDGLAPKPTPKVQPSLFSPGPTSCAAPPAARGATLLASFVGADGQPTARCFQSDTLEGAIAELADELSKNWSGGAMTLDVVRRTQALPDAGPILGAIILRPGSDGVCLGSRCLAPWQVVASDQFTRLSSFSALGTKMGLSGADLHVALGADAANGGFAGLTRIETQSFVRRADGSLEAFDKMRGDAPPVDRANLVAATKGALGFIVQAQEPDGRFRYLVDPFSGEASSADFSIPRQAGTTLALCEVGSLDDKTRDVARKSLALLASFERASGDKGGIVYPKGAARSAQLGSSALTMISLLGCRPRVGKKLDDFIGRLGAGLLASQRPDGSFAPGFDVDKGTPDPGKDPLYAEGQAVMALVLWEGASDMTRPDGLGKSIDRAMDHFAGPYWATPLHDFFFVEENWHCLAARAAIASGHRHDGYERFCIDYMSMKKRLELDHTSGVRDDAIGGYGFGNVIPPYHAATAGFAESLAAEMAVRRARGLSVEDDTRVLSETLGYLLRHQWTEQNCLYCTRKLRIPGAFSEHPGSAIIRIDYVQHSMAALAHGGRELGLLEATEVDGPV